MTCEQIAKSLNVSKATVKRALVYKKLVIPARAPYLSGANSTRAGI